MPRQFLFSLCCQEYANFDEVGLDHKDRDSSFVFKRGFGGMDFFTCWSRLADWVDIPTRWQTSKIGKLLLLRLNQRIDSAILFLKEYTTYLCLKPFLKKSSESYCKCFLSSLRPKNTSHGFCFPNTFGSKK